MRKVIFACLVQGLLAACTAQVDAPASTTMAPPVQDLCSPGYDACGFSAERDDGTLAEYCKDGSTWIYTYPTSTRPGFWARYDGQADGQPACILRDDGAVIRRGK